MNKDACLVIVVYPGKLKNLKKIVSTYKEINFVIFCNNFRTKPILDVNQSIFYLDYPIFESRVKMIKVLKKTNFKYFIFHDIDDDFNLKRYLMLPNMLKKHSFVVNDVIIGKKKYFSKRIKNDTEISYDTIANCNIAGMSNTSCRKSVIQKIKFYKDDKKKMMFDWVLWKKATKFTKGIFTNKVCTFYNVDKKRPTHLPTNYDNKIHINFIKKIRKNNGLSTKKVKQIKNNFWWEM